jgi:predicted metal-dependent hydrolase
VELVGLRAKRYRLKVIEADRPRSVQLSHGRMILLVHRGTETTKRQAILDEWYRKQLRTALPPLIAKWERLMGVKVRRVFIQRMKTKWGSCNHRAGSIRLNTDLARKPRECLEYADEGLARPARSIILFTLCA